MDISSVTRPDARDAKTQRQAELQALLARAEAATGGSHELDRDLALSFGWTRELDRDVYTPHHQPPWYWTDPDGYSEGHRDGEVGPAAFTRSLDAALALVERVLPGWRWMVRRAYPEDDARPLHVAYVMPADDTACDGVSTAPTPALALLAALLKALLSSGEQPSVCEQREQSAPATDEQQ